MNEKEVTRRTPIGGGDSDLFMTTASKLAYGHHPKKSEIRVKRRRKEKEEQREERRREDIYFGFWIHKVERGKTQKI